MQIDNAQLEFVHAAKDVGFMFCENKKDARDILKQLQMFYEKFNNMHYTNIYSLYN